VALRFLRGYIEGIQRIKSDREGAMKLYAKYTKVQDPEILSELYRIYGVKHLESIPTVKSEAVEEVLRSEMKGANAKPGDFIDNSLIAELEREGVFQKQR
jgi:ribosomal protein L20A (L18A)